MNKQDIIVAVADDHAVVRDSISKIVSSYDGFSVKYKAKNGKDLIEQLKVTTSTPEICLLDIQMPEMNGYETISYLKKNWPGVKVLALSMLDDEFSIIRILRLGACGFVSKSSTLTELRDALVSVHEKGYYSSELLISNFFQLMNDDTSAVQHKLSEKESAFLKYCPTELTLRKIAEKMHVSLSSVQAYRNSLFDKLNLKTRQGLAMFAIRTGIVSLNELNS